MRISIDVYSDPVCPWCFIGKRRLGRALSSRPDLEANVQWRAFQLNPAIPENGLERDAYLVSKFGSAEEANRLYEHIRTVGLRERIEFNFDDIHRTPSTIAAHLLIRFASERGKSDQAVEALFQAFFIHGKDIGQESELAAIAINCGLDADEFSQYAEDADAIDQVQNEDMVGRRIGIDGVPYFIIDGKYALSGAQEPEAFHNIFDMVIENERNTRKQQRAEVSPANL